MTIGSPLTAISAASSCSPACMVAPRTLTEPGATVVSPVSGAIVRWRILFGSPAFPYKLRVVTPGPGGSYSATGSSLSQSPVSAAVETFPSAIPITAGQTIALDLAANAPIGVNFTIGSYDYIQTPFADGASGTGVSSSGEIAFNADVQPVPAIAAVTPTKGSVGGSPVTITGADFSGATALSFGGVAASTFTVVSDTQITATAPKTKKPGPVDVTVTTVAGTSPPAPTQFTYTACVVPRLIGKKVKADRKKLKKAGCKLGKVRGEKSQAAKVVKQFRKPGTILPAGAKVGVKVEE